MSRVASALLVLITLVTPACSNETIVLGEVPETDAGTVPPPPVRCTVSKDCTNGFYCALSSCGATTGVCTPPAIDCPATEQPVCGCDNVTYFNDCLRQAYGANLASSNPCEPSSGTCGGPSNATCPSGTQCALLGSPHGGCDHDTPGTCWVLPPHCPTGTPANYWDACDPNGPVCLDTCTAIQTGGAYHRSMQCLN